MAPVSKSRLAVNSCRSNVNGNLQFVAAFYIQFIRTGCKQQHAGFMEGD